MDKCLKDAVYSKERHDSKLLQVRTDLHKQQKLYQTINLSSLPDKGAKIKTKIDELELLLKDLTICKPDSMKECVTKVEYVECRENAKECKKSIYDKNTKERLSDENFKENTIQSCSQIDKTANNLKCYKSEKFSKNLEDSGFGEYSSFLSSDDSLKNLEDSSLGDQSDSTFLKKHAPFSKPVVYTSFADLNFKGKDDISYQNIVESPAFKTYRHTKEIPSVKLIEAKPLFEKDKRSTKSASCNNSSKDLINEETVKQLHGCMNIYPEDTKEETQPLDLKTPLMKHQIEALSWLMWREYQNPRGGILADDMGLGKTLTMISLILKQKEKNNFSNIKEDGICKGTLIVCVASVVHQWENEITKHCKRKPLSVLLYHGPKREKNITYMRQCDVVLTTYNIVLSEKKALTEGKSSGLFQLKWERIILDEAHTIKNHASKTAEAVFSLSGFKKWCMTGTPIHNDFKDMYSLLKFLKFAPFDDYKKFKKLTDENGKLSDERRNMLVKTILLRRTKADKDASDKLLIEMKSKTSEIIFIKLSVEERKIYDDFAEKANNIIHQYFSNKKSFKNTSCLLVLLLRLQQCCNHVSLLGKEPEEIDDALDNIEAELSTLSLSEDSINDSYSESELDMTFSKYKKYSIYDPFMRSTKIKKLFEELMKISEESNNQAKIVIVSQWVSMLELIENNLRQEGIIYHIITGSTKAEDRKKMSEDLNFNPEGPKIMLLSLKAGGVGLNLMGASHLFLLDLHWNPALELQACDRIHRVGQKNDVFIHKFVCKETIEEKILDLQEKKKSVASAVFNRAVKVKKGLTIEDFKSLFDLRN